MCRHLAHLGPPTTLSALLTEPAHALLRQSWAPADMRGGGTVNADGFGAGWYPAHGTDPVRYRSDRPMWSDTSFAAIAGATSSGAVLAAVRSATVGMPVVATAAAPFAEGRWLFSHNGVVRGWPESVTGLAARLPVADLLTLDAPTDSALLWALVRHRLRAGEEPGAVLADVVTGVAAAAPGSRLNLLLTDGTAIWATAWDHALSVRTRCPDGDGAAAVTVVSEPFDDLPGWEAVPDRHLLRATPGRYQLDALTIVGSDNGVSGDRADAGDRMGTR
ncbi:ergothioneine biosynthesis protein EgtC [Pseudonocardia sp. N23]|uniref:ergothioneine biosynthesis protein EgtC n=1 Tax=Pseudonocardia sp. N23 TaxID=1987376 RepID=UPI000BFE3AA1|nr:ergothioneine biosynthesis protein EgtC [Pseudonocardia sp. N23]GAY12512.1 glutamine amidotransferase class-II [Pseudonocardia sp. N23]